MKKAILFILIIICVASNCCADTIKGTIEKVDIKEYYIIVDGNKVDVSKATIFTENDMNVVKNVIVRDLKDHKGETAVCYGSFDKENALIAYKVRVLEGHK
ncbi:MAG: hypothetical protein NTY34_01955 [Candidatus Omnitrophica bacterium]|nr:hypothetical protein [Candidatus Omnitrophota bacterium]